MVAEFEFYILLKKTKYWKSETITNFLFRNRVFKFLNFQINFWAILKYMFEC